MSAEMSFAQALNEAKGVIVQLSNRVKADAEKIKNQQSQIGSLSASLAAVEGKEVELKSTLAATQSDLEKSLKECTASETRAHELTEQLQQANITIDALRAERDGLLARVPSDDDTAALSAMVQLLTKAQPAIDKVKARAGTTTAEAVAA